MGTVQSSLRPYQLEYCEQIDQRVKIFNAVIDDERCDARRTVIATFRIHRPDGRSVARFAVRIDPAECGTAPRLNVDAEMRFAAHPSP